MKTVTEIRVAVYEVTEWKDGAVYRTKRLEDAWLPIEGAATKSHPESNKFYGPADTFETRRVESQP